MTARPHAAKARRIPRSAPPCVMVIFGAGGDLAKRLLAPALSAALYTRFRSRQDDPFADRLLAALRQQFGGHAVKKS